MSEPFLSEIRIVSFNFPPKGWALCNGQLMPINQNQALFSLLGTTYGGNGQTTFALPNLRGRVPVHVNTVQELGEAAGSTSVTLSTTQLPQHTHVLNGTRNLADQGSTAAGVSPANSYLADSKPSEMYDEEKQNFVSMNPAVITNAGGSQPHNNMMPYLVLNFIIALQGIFPSRND